MRIITALLSVLFATYSGYSAHADAPPVPVIGEAAPDFNVTDIQGNAVSLEALKGKIVALEWTNHLCPFVQKHYDSGNMQKTQTFAKEQGIVWISVISSAEGKQGYVSAEEAANIAKQAGAVPAHIIRDPSGEFGRAYHAKTTPHIYMIDKAGKLAYMGAIDNIASVNKEDIGKATNYAKAAMQSLLSGRTPDSTTTSPYGCSIKYDY